MSIADILVDNIDAFLSYLNFGLKNHVAAYCELETAETETVLVARDGSLISILQLQGSMNIIGKTEFEQLHTGITQTLSTGLSRFGHATQVFFSYDPETIRAEIEKIYAMARQTATYLHLNLLDLFHERITFLSRYCATESVYFVLWTRPEYLTKEQLKRANKEKRKQTVANKIPTPKHAQNLTAGFEDIRNAHNAFVRAVFEDFSALHLRVQLLKVHAALHAVRMSVDPDFTAEDWRPVLPGDKIPTRSNFRYPDDIANLLYPPLAEQLFPRESEQVDLRTVRIGDKIYSSVFIDLFPIEVQAFQQLFHKLLPSQIPWRISFMVESHGLQSLQLRTTLASILSFSAPQNRLLADAITQLREVSINGEETVVRLKVTLTTWAPEKEVPVLRHRTSLLAKAVQGWGNCNVTELSGDPFGGVVSSMLGISTRNEANPAAAPLSDVVAMLPITRPASPWKTGALLFRSPDGKVLPYQPGSALQTTWIDILYARPGSGKSVLSNAINLALCLSAGLKRLPRIAIIDIGPSSSGLISLLREALPTAQRHQVLYQRLRMTEEFSINPCDTQLGARFPTPQERSFLVNFMVLLLTPVGQVKPYDAISDMAGLVVDEMYKVLSDKAKPTIYTQGLEPLLDNLLDEIGFIGDAHTTWWEVTDALFLAGFSHEAMLAQRYAVPIISDAASIVRTKSIEDLYGEITAPTGESLIDAFSRMISSAVREYPVLSKITQFDLGDAKIVALDLDEVAKTGGETADKQTAVMYMLARYVLAKDFYLTEANVQDMPKKYQSFHLKRVKELREDPKRIVYDEFHRTSKAQAVREQVIVDMREGRKWKVQIALVSQSIDDFDEAMIEFATSIYIMDAGPKKTIEKTAKTFGLTESATLALSSKVHGPREGGGTFLAQFSTKNGSYTQLLTLSIGAIELWAFSTTADDVKLRNLLYSRIGAVKARQLLARFFPHGTAVELIEKRLNSLKKSGVLIGEVDSLSVIEKLAEEILMTYNRDPRAHILM